MLANVVRLELKKQKKDFLVVVGLAAAILLCFITEAIFRNRNLAEIFKDVFGYLSIGFVFVLALTGANAGIHLRVEPYRSAEEPLPFSPPQKAISAYLVNVLYLLIGASLFLITTNAFGFLKELDWIQPALFIFLIIHFHMLCFIFAYWLNHSILAIVLASLVVWGEFLLIKQRTFFFLFLHNPYVSIAEPVLSVWSVISLIVSFAGGLITLWLISGRIERQRNIRWIPGLLASLILTTGTLLLFVDLMRTSHYAQTKLSPDNHTWWRDEYLSMTPIQRERVYLTSKIGSILFVSSEQRKVLRQVPFKLFSRPNQFDVVAMYEGPNTSEILAIIRNDEADNKDYGIWRSGSGEGLKLHSEFNSKGVWPTYIVKCKDQFCVYGYTPQKIAWATIGEKGLGEWQFIDYQNSEMGFLGAIRKHLFQDAAANGDVALLSPDKTYLTRNQTDGKIQKWSLPGKGDLSSFMASIITPAFHKDGQPYFVVTVNKEEKYSLFVCNPDDTVSQLWKKTWTANERLTWEGLPEGGYGWVLRQAQSWKPIEAFVVNENGNPFPPFPIETTSEYASFVDFVKRENSLLWVLMDDRFSKIDLQTGKRLKQFNIDADEPDYQNIFRTRTKEGVYFVKDDRIKLIDWNGQVKDLGPASLN